MSDSLWPQGLQHARLPCPSPSPGACSNSCPSSWWCHPTISSSFTPFSSCLQSFPASGSFLMNWFFISGDQSIGASASAPVLLVKYSGLISFRIDWLHLLCGACNAGDPGSIPGSGKSSREGNGNPLQYSCLENPMDRGVWQAIVHGVAKRWKQLSYQHFQIQVI